tara:strand:+ start:3226 stop:4002 length:777 start_codon:yes stop_codon:yes gene_type:complete
MLISVLQPTRGRAGLSIKGIESLIVQANDIDNIEFIFRFDDDDTETLNEVRTYFDKKYPNVNMKYLVGERHGYCHMEKYWDEITHEAKGEYCVTWTDDQEMDPDNEGHWDDTIREAEGQFYLLDFPEVNCSHPTYKRWPQVTPYPKKLYEIMGNRLSPNVALDRWFIEIIKSNDIWVRCPEKHIHYQAERRFMERDKTYEEGRGTWNRVGGHLKQTENFKEFARDKNGVSEDAKLVKKYLEENPNSIKFETNSHYFGK